MVPFFGIAEDFVSATMAFGSKRSLSIDAVAGVHVVGEHTAVRMASAVACKEHIIIQNIVEKSAVLLKCRHYSNLNQSKEDLAEEDSVSIALSFPN